MPDHAEVEPLLDSYVLGALPDESLIDVESHLAECLICQAEYASLLKLAPVLKLGVPQVDPPPSLRDRILSAAAMPDDAAADAPGEVVRLDRHRRESRVPVYWVAAAAILPLLVSGWLVLQVVTLRTSMSAMQADAKQAWTAAENVTDIMGRGIEVGAGAVHAEGTDMAPSARGMMYYLPTHQDGVLVVDGLPSLPKDQCYQVWLISGDQWMNGGTFYLGGDGRGIVAVKSPMPLSSIDTVRVTMEPHGGSEEPRGNRYLWARLTRT